MERRKIRHQLASRTKPAIPLLASKPMSIHQWAQRHRNWRPQEVTVQIFRGREQNSQPLRGLHHQLPMRSVSLLAGGGGCQSAQGRSLPQGGCILPAVKGAQFTRGGKGQELFFSTPSAVNGPGSLGSTAEGPMDPLRADGVWALCHRGPLFSLPWSTAASNVPGTSQEGKEGGEAARETSACSHQVGALGAPLGGLGAAATPA
ncbi:uncharacterized protein LOC128347707 isoform X2 [Hemicordylus capensis]|nr:uncharacterized protein LOC128347707 isoform X2 [Hemicordylus capensis]